MVKNQKGITLIALIITIIVMLILAAVVIAMATGENGVIGKARESKAAQTRADMKTAVSLAYAEILADYHSAAAKANSTDTSSLLASYFTYEKFRQAYDNNGGPALDGSSTLYSVSNDNTQIVSGTTLSFTSTEYDQGTVGISVTFSTSGNSSIPVIASNGMTDI